MIIGGIPDTSALQVTVNVFKNKIENLPGRRASTDLPFPEAAQ